MRQRKRQELEATIAGILRSLGHASPDPQVVSHCPFCGSGDIVARSDGNVECVMCHRQFSIAEQPAYSAVPGAPNDGPAPAPPDASAPQSKHEIELPPVDPQAAAAAPPFQVPEDKDKTDDGPVSTADDGDKKKPEANGKPSFLTDKGAKLSRDDYAMHLALKLHPEVREAVLHGGSR